MFIKLFTQKMADQLEGKLTMTIRKRNGQLAVAVVCVCVALGYLRWMRFSPVVRWTKTACDFVQTAWL
jgi:hypothetical protein